MSKKTKIPLQPLRVPVGWLVEWNTFSEAQPTFETYDESSWEFSEDMLLLSNSGTGLVVSLGWRPGHRADGAFVLTAARARGATVDWDKPLKQLRCRSKERVIKALENWLEGRLTA